MTTRRLYLIGIAICIGSLGFAYFYLEQKLGLAPCPLCVLDRIVFVAISLCLLIGFIHNPQVIGRRIYAGISLLLSLTGIGLATQHIYLQSLPPEQTPGCLPDLSYMLEQFPLLETMQMILSSAGECAQISWTFLGLSIPQQTLLVFFVLLVLSLALWIKKESSAY